MSTAKSGINAASYDKIADMWVRARGQHSLSSLVVDFAARVNAAYEKSFSQNKNFAEILDIGCGAGYPIARYLTDSGFRLTGIDVSAKMIEKAKDQKIPNSEFFICDFFDFVPKHKFDGIIAFDSFFHFPKERQSEIYTRVSAWMKDGAYLLFTHGGADSEIDGTMFGEKFYYSALDVCRVHELLIESGFAIEESIIDYREEVGNRDLVIVARKQCN